VPGLALALHAAVQRGAAGAALSGSGPTLFALIDKKVASRSVGHAMQKAFATRKIQSHWLALNVERKGVIISHHSPL
jgi:homoserine kinase